MDAEIRAYCSKERRQQLHVSQNRISKLEYGDIEKSQVDTNRKYIEAMGGTLRIDVQLGDETFQLA